GKKATPRRPGRPLLVMAPGRGNRTSVLARPTGGRTDAIWIPIEEADIVPNPRAGAPRLVADTASAPGSTQKTHPAGYCHPRHADRCADRFNDSGQPIDLGVDTVLAKHRSAG